MYNNEIIVTYNTDREIIKEGESWVYTDSLNLADVLQYPHKEVSKRIRKILQEYNIGDSTGELNSLVDNSAITNVSEFVEKNTDFSYSISYYKDQKGEMRPYYKLSKDLLVLVIFSFRKLPNAQELQKAYIAKFNIMEKELDWHRARYLGIDVRNNLTQAIQLNIEIPKFYHYKNFTDLIYKTLYGKSSKVIRNENGLEPDANIRLCISQEDLKKVEKVEEEIVVLLSYGFDYSKIKSLLEKRYASEKNELNVICYESPYIEQVIN